MKFQLLFLVVLAVVATLFTTETEAAPSKQHGKHQLFTGSNIKLWTGRLGQFLRNGKRQEQKTSPISPKSIKNTEMTRATENPALLKLVHYLRWLDELVIEDFYNDLTVLVEDTLEVLWHLDDYLYKALQAVGVDVLAFHDEYYNGLEDEFYGFLEEAEVFWKSWVDDPEHIRENLLIHIPQIEAYLKVYGTPTSNYFMTMVYLSQTLLTPDAYAELLVKVQDVLDSTGAAIDSLKASLKPPTDIVPPPTVVTIEDLLGFPLYLSQLNVTSIILDGLSTVQQLRGVRLTFDKDLVALFGEGSVDGADLGSQGQNITATIEAAVDARYTLNRIALDNLVYSYFYGVGWDFLYAFSHLVRTYFDGLEEIPPLSVETIAQLEGLVEALSPEYQQRASELVTQALQKSDSLIKKYLEVFQPTE